MTDLSESECVQLTKLQGKIRMRSAKKRVSEKRDQRNAAVKMQNVTRGRNARKKVEQIRILQNRERDDDYQIQNREKDDAAIKVQSALRRKLVAKNVHHQQKLRDQAREQRAAAIKMQSLQRSRNSRKKVNEHREQRAAAIKMQSIQRSRNSKKRVNEIRDQKKAAIAMQSVQRRRSAMKKVNKIRQEKEDKLSGYEDDWEEPPATTKSIKVSNPKRNLESLLILERTLALELELLSELSHLQETPRSRPISAVRSLYPLTPIRKIEWQVGEMDPSFVNDGSMFTLPTSLGKQIEGKKHRQTAPNVPFSSASTDNALYMTFANIGEQGQQLSGGKHVFSKFNPKEIDLPGPNHYTPKGHYKHLQSSEKVINFGRSAPRNHGSYPLLPFDGEDHRKNNKNRKGTTAFDHGRLNPTIHRKQLSVKRGPGYYNPSPVRKKSPSASFGTISVLDDKRHKLDLGFIHLESGVGRRSRKSSFGISSRFSKEIKSQSEKTLPELLEETRKELYYKSKKSNTVDFVNHDSALGQQRLSKRRSAPKGLQF